MQEEIIQQRLAAESGDRVVSCADLGRVAEMANERSTSSLPIYTTGLGWLVVLGCAYGVVANLTSSFGYTPADQWAIAVVVAAAALVLAGMFSFGKTSRWLSLGLATVGALTAGVFLLQTLVVPVVALVFIVLFVMSALRRRPVIGGVGAG
ncbi:MAG TPA: hypothetical protein VFV53_02100 [Candidatus Limnocylindrales bacterium]|nr:hypothetical protein [Candidatus Limnocylindrales bacterium]